MQTLAKQSKKLGLDFIVAATRLYACAPKLGIKRYKQPLKAKALSEEHKDTDKLVNNNWLKGPH
ncbi:hypothetical protein [Amygdalobacter nucleatus]|uniref:Uncharacterized protein n=1 Tax=Amygdalobacter nucleatus TaxID=3029274 RepID=A0A133YAL9_9FIRM|nr:hypothetical protein [Amygdalobacter nucleatus]KXB40204.1 hypothetical protein HMPREF1872_01016 [Amygdalobacter nucleatus]MDF0485771.1 hypothetical protein [Amygdalobacter nucleatus]